ncbi:MAG: DUF2817 domain-containing protein [Spirochaetales bacterium]|nr:DUF2817 domain-containing protein [Spirochaetales bacterium]
MVAMMFFSNMTCCPIKHGVKTGWLRLVFIFAVLPVICSCINPGDKERGRDYIQMNRSSSAACLVASSIIGQSVNDKSIKVVEVGAGYETGLVVIGGIHGNERNTAALVGDLMGIYTEKPNLVPRPLRLFFVPLLNPDGFEQSGRKNIHGVDLNRNFPTSNWRSDAISPFRRIEGSGGQTPASEPEVRAIVDWLLDEVKRKVKKVYLISYHSAYKNGSVQPGYRFYGKPDEETVRFAARIAETAGYTYLNTWITSNHVTGELINWCGENGITSVDIELPSYESPDIVPAGKNETTRQTHERVLAKIMMYLEEGLSTGR